MKNYYLIILLLIGFIACVNEEKKGNPNKQMEIADTSKINISKLFTDASNKSKTASERRKELFQIRNMIVHNNCTISVNEEELQAKKLYENIMMNKYSNIRVEDYQMDTSSGQLTYLKITTSTNE